LQCPKCRGSIIYKSFNPWISTIGGILVLGGSLATVFISGIPVIWIGGFILGGSLLFKGFSQWSEIEKLDSPIDEKKNKTQEPIEDQDHMVVTCGSCFEKIKLRKGRGATKTRCPKCGRETVVYT
jgi:predicted RNA-binding Zn-ribbon protein involved in translation (DUF1610 family)